MPAYIVKGCTNRSSVKNRQQELEKTMKITLHAFPKCRMKRQLWLNSLGLENSVVPKCAAVCSVHFKPEDLDRTSLACVRLKENAIPYHWAHNLLETNMGGKAE
ncbi:uncharacterized protein LOC143211168 isoform X1 [Lasioglossum baleicum]|uniref:uncharacterized protein LOC143211168 isoform X1 n=1 Tax=Lasioglossum baleicum TaxID=434251 RepID=UPI003FCC5E6C